MFISFVEYACRDAWSLGAIDPTSGTATILEITRAIGEMYRKGK